MKRTGKIVIAAVTAVAIGTVGTLSYVGTSQAGPGWGGHHGGMHMRGGPGMRIGKAMIIERMHELADRDGDGRVSRDEALEAFGEMFERYDANGDGTLDIDEFDGLFREITRPAMVRAFQFLDRDGAGELDREDLEARLGRAFDWLDRSGDGTVSRSEHRGPRWHGRESRRGGEWRGRRGEMRERHREMRREMRRSRGAADEAGEVEETGADN